MTSSPYCGHAAMFLFSVLVAGSFSLGPQVLPFIDPVAVTAVRFAIAGAFLSTVSLAMFRFDRVWLKAPWRYGLLGASMAVYFALMFVALQTATPVSTSAVFTLAPIFSAFFGYVLLRQKTTPWIALALAVGASGALWVIFRGSLADLIRLNIGRGEAIFVLGTMAHGLYAPLIPFLKRREPTVVFTAGMLVAGTVLLAGLGAPALMATQWVAIPGSVWAIIAYLSIGTTALTFFLVQFAAQRLPASKVMAYTYIIPSWVILWELVQGVDPPDAIVLWGVGLTVLALLMLLRR